MIKMKKGFSLVEMIVYVALLAVIFIVVVNSLMAIMSSYNSIKSAKDIENSAMLGLDRMERDIKNATSITAISTSTDPNSITLDTGVQFYVATGTLSVNENGVYSGPLSVSGVTVTSLLFYPITTANSKAVRIQMTINGKNFYDTAVMRGSY